MSIILTAPGVIKRTTRIFVTQEDVMTLFDCGKSKAYSIIRDVNKHAKERGQCPFMTGKASKYLFSELYGIPIEEVDSVINGE